MRWGQPLFVTFTGIDQDTNLNEVAELDAEYPGMIEWAVLLSKQRAGTFRYPRPYVAQQLLERVNKVALHLCGEYAREVVNHDRFHLDLGVLPYRASRIQINMPNSNFCSKNTSVNSRLVLQCRLFEFPINHNVDWLYDCSGGEGITPEAWPPSKASDPFHGYAGGIRPDNVEQVLQCLYAGNQPGSFFWIDMESGIRDENNAFSIAKCRRVMQLVTDAK